MFAAKTLCYSQLTQLTASAQLIRNSPNFLLSPANKDIGSVYTWGALAAGDLTPLRSQAAILFVDNNFNCSVSAEYVPCYCWQFVCIAVAALTFVLYRRVKTIFFLSGHLCRCWKCCQGHSGLQLENTRLRRVVVLG